MQEILQKLSAPLSKNDIELRVQSVTEKGFSVLIYKTARTDVKRLNDVLGINWKNHHFYDNARLLCCEISIFDKETNQWIGRSDVGTESQTEKEKGGYSDSFKRAGFRWGIGIELYNAPFVFVQWQTKQREGAKGFDLVDFYSSNLDISEYTVEDGFPKFTITYSGKEIWSNIKKLDKKDEKKKDEPINPADGSAQKVGFKNNVDGEAQYAKWLARIQAIDTIGKLNEAKPHIEAFIERLAKWNSQFAENFRSEYEKKRKDIGDLNTLLDDEIPDFTNA